MNAPAFGIGDKVCIFFDNIILKILESECSGHGSSNTIVCESYDIINNMVKMTSTTYFCVGHFIETIYTYLYLRDVRGKFSDTILSPQNSIRENCCFKARDGRMDKNIVEIIVHERFPTRERDKSSSFLVKLR